MKIVCKLSVSDTMIREIDMGSALVGYRITEIRLDKKDMAVLVGNLTSDSPVVRIHALEYLQRLQTKFPPGE